MCFTVINLKNTVIFDHISYDVFFKQILVSSFFGILPCLTIVLTRPGFPQFSF